MTSDQLGDQPGDLYLSRIPLDHVVLRSHRDLRDRGRVHRSVMSIFGDLGGDQHARSRGSVLFRIDEDRFCVLVQSAVAPVRNDVVTAKLPDLSGLPAGMPARARVCVNAVTTKNRTRDGKTRQYREAVPEREAVDWIAGRLDGLTLVGVRDQRREVCRSGRSPLVLTTVDLDVIVTEPARLVPLVRDGIGRGRAYGGGLITLAPGS